MLFRPTSTAAAGMRHFASKLALAVKPGGMLRRIQEVFIFIATRGATGNPVVKVIEVPVNLVAAFAGKRLGFGNYYIPSTVITSAPMLDSLLKEDIKVDPDTGQQVPHLADEQIIERLAWGKGLLRVGELPPWSELRNALNRTTGCFYNNPSAVTVSLCPGFTDETATGQDAPLPARSFLVCRATGAMTDGPAIIDKDQIVLADIPDRYPAINGEPFDGALQSLSGIEFSASGLGLASNEVFVLGGTCLEWGPAIGCASVLVASYDEDKAPIDTAIVFVAYSIRLLEQGGAALTTEWNVRFDQDAVGTSERSSVLSAQAAATDGGWTFPEWAFNTLVMGERAAHRPIMPIEDLRTVGRWYAVGDEQAGRQTILGLVHTRPARNGSTVDVKGVRNDGSGSTQVFTRPTDAVFDLDSHVLSVQPDGAISHVRVNRFRYDVYDTGGAMEEAVLSCYCGVSTAPSEALPHGEGRLFCVENRVTYTWEPGEAASGPPWNYDAQPDRRLPHLRDFGKPDSQSYFLLSASGTRTPLQFGAYYPALYSFNNELLPGADQVRKLFGTTAWQDDVVDGPYGTNFPQPMCQFAPGYCACVVFPRAQFTQDQQDLRIAVFRVADGAMLYLTRVLMITPVESEQGARFCLTCLEQGTLDEQGALQTFGRLLLTVSTRGDNTTAGRGGCFLITGLSAFSWLMQQTSYTTAPVYGGNALVTASIGKTAKLSAVKPTAVPQ